MQETWALGLEYSMLGNPDEEPPVPHQVVFTDDADKILEFARDSLRSGLSAALVTLVDIQGGAARSLGAHMAVGEDGRFCGFVSGGCVETTVAAEAVQAIKLGADRTLVLGQGSKFFDIVLPCGGAITLTIHVLRQSEVLDRVLAGLADRKRTGLQYDPKAYRLELKEGTPRSRWEQGSFITSYRPTTRIIFCGRSIELAMATKIAKAAAYDVVALEGAAVVRSAQLDEDSAIAFLHHDLDMEMASLEIALESDAFYIGALGSKRTHQRRCDELARRGFSDAAIARIRAPLGLFPKARDARSLALSLLAEIAACHTVSK